MLLDVFRQARDGYIDNPFEEAMLRWEHQTRKVFQKFYGEAEVEIDDRGVSAGVWNR